MSKKIVSMGELLIDFVALERDVRVGEALRFEKAAGGAPANVAVGVAQLGIPSAFITQLGQDPFGYFLRDTLAAKNVDISGIRLTAKANTMLAFVAVEASGERSFAFYRNPSADMLMTPQDLELPLLENAAIFHFGSITLIDEPVRTTTLHAAQIAREHGALISYDPNLREVLWRSADEARAGIHLGLGKANLVKMNEGELAFLHKRDAIATIAAQVEAGRALWHDNLQLLVITRGGDGCLAITPDQYWVVEGFSVQIEDTIGAGDGFMAGLLVGIYEYGINPEFIAQILRQANAVGAITASRRGAIPALPSRTEVMAFLAQSPSGLP